LGGFVECLHSRFAGIEGFFISTFNSALVSQSQKRFVIFTRNKN
jgi:hypothetical protein